MFRFWFGIALFIFISLSGCVKNSEQEKKSTNSNSTGIDQAATLILPSNNESLKDSLYIIKADECREKSESFPLFPFFLGYEEWQTIGCIIAKCEECYWNKVNIGAMLISDSLAVNFLGNEISLGPGSLLSFDEGIWSSFIKNDSICIRLSTNFKNGRILRSITGHGVIELTMENKVIVDSCYFVAKTNST